MSMLRVRPDWQGRKDWLYPIHTCKITLQCLVKLRHTDSVLCVLYTSHETQHEMGHLSRRWFGSVQAADVHSVAKQPLTWVAWLV